jgi:hypothetical protein
MQVLEIIIENYKVLVDKETKSIIDSRIWRIKINPSGQIYFVSHDNKNYETLHRLIMDCPKGMVVDHINGDTLDNRKSNLRICTKLQNQYNQKKHKGNKHSKYKGVTLRKELKSKPWEAFIYANRTHRRLGYFATEIEAAEAYNKAALQMYGEYAKLNELDI